MARIKVPEFVHIPRVGYVARQLSRDEQGEIIAFTAPEKSKSFVAERGSRRISPSELWKILAWSKGNCPELYRDILNPDLSQILNGTFSIINKIGSTINAKYVSDEGEEFNIGFPEGEPYSVLDKPPRNKIISIVRFNQEDTNPETGFPLNSREVGEFDFEYFLDPNVNYAVTLDPICRTRPSLEVTCLPHTSKNRQGINPLCVREIR